MKKILKAIDLCTSNNFVEKKDGIITTLVGDIQISNLLIHSSSKNNPDGLYRLTKFACDGTTCSIGRPAKKCVRSGTYRPNHCATFYLDYLEPCTTIHCSIEEIKKISTIIEKT